MVAIRFFALVGKLDDLGDLVLGVSVRRNPRELYQELFLGKEWRVKDLDRPPLDNYGRGVILLFGWQRNRQLPA